MLRIPTCTMCLLLVTIDCRFFFKEYYLVALGFYLQELFTLVLLDEKLKDFYVMFSHHVATIYLILISLACGYGVQYA